MCFLSYGDRDLYLGVYRCDSFTHRLPVAEPFAAGLTALSLVENVFPDSECGELEER